jgi:hypothetical protein
VPSRRSVDSSSTRLLEREILMSRKRRAPSSRTTLEELREGLRLHRSFAPEHERVDEKADQPFRLDVRVDGLATGVPTVRDRSWPVRARWRSAVEGGEVDVMNESRRRCRRAKFFEG